MRERRLFGTDGIRGVANEYPMIPEVAVALGQALASVFRGGKGRMRVVVGKDTRLSGYMFETALAAGVCSMGGGVLLAGTLPTPGIAYMTLSMRAEAGAVISASHNPFEDNGIKFFGGDGFKLPDEMESLIESFVENPTSLPEKARGAKIGRAERIEDAVGRYCVALKSLFPRDLSLDWLRIVVDCANGAAYRVAPMVFEELGAKVVKMGVEPNGTNINEQCGALYPEAMARKVAQEGAHLGLALDGDGDRAILADEKGRVVDGDGILAICARYMLDNDLLKGGGIVGTVMTNFGLERFLKSVGLQLVRTDVGDRYVVEAMKEMGMNLGGEQSGHIVFLDDSTTGDGILSCLKVLEVMARTGKPLSELANLFERFPQILVSKKVKKKVPFDSLRNLPLAVRASEDVLRGRGRVNVRYSGTSCAIRMMLEGEDESELQKLADEIVSAIEKDGILCE
jgi:phosphoglucosamine mutase